MRFVQLSHWSAVRSNGNPTHQSAVPKNLAVISFPFQLVQLAVHVRVRARMRSINVIASAGVQSANDRTRAHVRRRIVR